MEEIFVGADARCRACRNRMLRRALKGTEEKGLWCDGCKTWGKERPYSCVEHDWDLCPMCYMHRLHMLRGTTTARSRRAGPALTPMPMLSTPARAARFSDAQDEQEAAPAAAEVVEPAVPQQSPKPSRKERSLLMKGNLRSIVPFHDPSLQKHDKTAT